MTQCPICLDKLAVELSDSKFYYCEKCAVAIRTEKNMSLKKHNIYDEQWTVGEDKKIFNTNVAHYRLNQINELCQQNEIKTILDVGCGSGILVDLLSKNGFIVDGLDTSESNIEFAKRFKKGHYFLGDIDSLTKKKQYDLIVMSHLIEHFRVPDSIIKKVKTFMKKMEYCI